MQSVSSELKTSMLYTMDGRHIPFEALYENCTTAVIFVRHFGCIFCRERIDELSQYLPRIKASGGHAVIIGVGSAAMAAGFADAFKTPIPIYSDPDRNAYRLAGMTRNFGISLKTIGRAWTNYKKGRRQGAVQGDPWQQGGLMVIRKDGVVLNHQVDREAGSVLDWSAMMTAIRDLRRTPMGLWGKF